VINAKDWDRFGGPDDLGSAELPLSKLRDNMVTGTCAKPIICSHKMHLDCWLPLRGVKSGKVHLHVTINATGRSLKPSGSSKKGGKSPRKGESKSPRKSEGVKKERTSIRGKLKAKAMSQKKRKKEEKKRSEALVNRKKTMDVIQSTQNQRDDKVSCGLDSWVLHSPRFFSFINYFVV